MLFQELSRKRGASGVRKAITRGINDAVVSKVRGSSMTTPLKAARDSIYRHANLKRKRINRGTKVSRKDRADINQERPVARITANQYRISLTSYGARYRGGKNNKRVEVATRRGGGRQTMPKAFIQNAGRSKTPQVLQRQPGVGRLPIRRRSGPSLGYWLTQRATARAVESTAREFVPNRITYHMQRELNGMADKARKARAAAIKKNAQRFIRRAA